MSENPLNPIAEQDSLIEYPCAFPLKIMGKAEDSLADAVLEIVSRHDPEFVAATMEMRASSGGNYLSLTCTVVATSKPQLDALYTDLSSHPLVKVVL